MNKTEQKIPALRFPEFEGEWEKKRLGEFTKINQGLQIAIAERLTEKVPHSYFYITNEFLKKGSEKKYYIINPPRSALCYEEDILMTRTGNTGIVVTGVEGAFHNNFFKIQFDRSKYDSAFIISFLRLEETQKQIIKYAGTSTIPDLNHSDFYKLKIHYPSLSEQQKIADFLSAVDKRLQLLKDKKTKLEEYKRGVMQRIFSQELRFTRPDGSAYPDWKEKKLGEISERITKKNSELNKNVLTISAQEGLINQLKYFNNSVAAKNISGYYLLYKDDFAYNKSYSKGYPMGAIKRLKNYPKGIVSTLYVCFRNKKEFTNLFAEQYFESGIHNRELGKVAQEGARNHGLLNIGVGDFFDTIILLPCLEEQRKIADFLSAIADKIVLLTKQIESTEQYKKGLLQQLFV